MRYRTLGRTGIRVSGISFGAGPVSGLMTGDNFAAQSAALRRAIDLGINWIDTAPGYGKGKSEASLGRALAELDARDQFNIATKVRLAPDQLANIRDSIRRSVIESLKRLGLPAVTLLQLHNGLTAHRGDEPFSITPADVLGPGGVLETFRELRDLGLIKHLGLTATGEPVAMRDVVSSGGFDTIQVPYHLLNPSAGRPLPSDIDDVDYGNIIADAAELNLGVFAIRVFAGGALLGRAPSAHTLTTPFFPLAQFLKDRERADQIAHGRSLKEVALRFVLDDARVHSAIVGIGSADEIAEIAELGDWP